MRLGFAVGDVGQGPVGRLPFGDQRVRVDQHRRHDARAEQQARHDDGRRGQQLPRVANAAQRAVRIVVRIALHQRHHGHAGFESAQAQRQLGKEQQAGQRRPPASPLPFDARCASRRSTTG